MVFRRLLSPLYARVGTAPVERKRSHLGPLVGSGTRRGEGLGVRRTGPFTRHHTFPKALLPRTPRGWMVDPGEGFAVEGDALDEVEGARLARSARRSPGGHRAPSAEVTHHGSSDIAVSQSRPSRPVRCHDRSRFLPLWCWRCTATSPWSSNGTTPGGGSGGRPCVLPGGGAPGGPGQVLQKVCGAAGTSVLPLAAGG